MPIQPETFRYLTRNYIYRNQLEKYCENIHQIINNAQIERWEIYKVEQTGNSPSKPKHIFTWHAKK